MRNFVPVFGLLFYLSFTISAFAQTSKTRYFTSQWLTKEVPKSKAKFSQSTLQYADSTIIEIKDLSKKLIVIREVYKGKEPYGLWKNSLVRGGSYINYNFPLIYANPKCDSARVITTDYFQNNDSIGYKAPVMQSNASSLSQFIYNRIVYPSRAMDENMQGIVYTLFTITEQGTVENIVVTKGVNILLDKEAVRVVRQLKFATPAMWHDKPIALPCMALPIKFIIED